MEFKYIVIGLLLGLFLVAVGKWGFITLFVGAGLILLLGSLMDWSGQGDGRQGCNRHTNCNH